MKHGQLRDHFMGIGVKRLSAVDAEPSRSNQHEIGTTQAMRSQFLGTVHGQFQVVYIWLGQEQDGFTLKVLQLIMMHANNNHIDPLNGVFITVLIRLRKLCKKVIPCFWQSIKTGVFTLLLHQTIPPVKNNCLGCLVFTHTGNPLCHVNLQTMNRNWILPHVSFLMKSELSWRNRDADNLDGIIERFGTAFPSTVEFSDLARQTLPDVRVEDNPDGALVAWLSHEESLISTT